MSALTLAQPDVESLPPYSPADAAPPNEPPPAYQPSSSSATLPHYSAAAERPPVSKSQPTPGTTASQLPPERTYTRREQYRLLKDIFSRHPWRRAWGHQPTSFDAVLNVAASHGRQHIIDELFALGVKLHGNRDCAVHYSTPMHAALLGPNPSLAIYFLDVHQRSGGQADELLESKDEYGCTPLHIAAHVGETAIASLFIELHGVEVDPVDDIGRTPLHLAARSSRTETIDMLLDHGADPGWITQRHWNFDNLHLRDEREAARRTEQLGSWAFISKTLRGALERRNQWAEAALFDDGAGSYQLAGTGQENMDPDKIPTKPAAASSPAASQPRSLESDMAGSSARGLIWGLETLIQYPHKAPALSNHQQAEIAACRQHRARVRATQNSGGLSSPEYIRWKQGLDDLFQESRRQKEKNRRDEENALGLGRD